ncbi:MAG TPA: ABC transporter permease [Microthrixaceae bacterium]|nr:ABC transporter permease [Microthrixaceae bacterium]
MSPGLRLLPLLLRRSPRQSAGAIALCAVGVAIATLVAGVALGAYHGFGARQPKVVWRSPTPAAEAHVSPVALQRRSTDWFDGRRIDRVDLAALGPAGQVPAPPGLRAAPAPGTAWVSPALAELIASHPSDQLGDRFGQVVGRIGAAGVAHPDELVAVVGATPDQLGPATSSGSPNAVLAPDRPGDTVPVASFDTTGADRDLMMYRSFALVAVVLVVVPAVVLIGSSARLTAARREQRMAALRLAGATSGAVRLLAVAETTVGAAIGAVIGIGSAMAVSGLLVDIAMAGGRWFPADIRLPASSALALFVATIAVCAAATAVSLRRVGSRPLGVAASAEPASARWPRVLGMLAAIALLCVTTVAATAETFTGSNGQPKDMTVPMVAALATVIASLALVGPWVTSLVGRIMVRSARRTPLLLAGRRVLEDPRAAYRTVSAVVLAGLTAGFLAGVMPTVQALERDGLPSGAATAVLDRPAADAVLAAAGEERRVDTQPGGEVSEPVDLVVLASGPRLERIRTATTAIRGGRPLVASDDDLFGDITFTADAMRGSFAVLASGLLLAFGASGVAAAAAVVDQRRLIGRLVLCGTEVSTLQRARRLQTVLPLAVATIGSVVIGLGGSFLLMVGFGLSAARLASPNVGVLGLIVVAAIAMGLASASFSRPMLIAAARSATGGSPASA